MTFNQRESSRLNGRPFHLYEFKLGEEVVARYTNLTTEIAHGQDAQGQPIVYAPWPISHGEVTAAGNLDKSNLPVRLPESGALPDLYRDETPSDVLALIIRQGHVADTDMKVCWAGRVMGVSYEGPDMVLDCEPVTSSLRRPGLTRDYQYACPLVLYGAQCRASRQAATIASTAVAVDGPLVTLPAGWAPEDRRSKFIGGIAEWTTGAGRKMRRGIVDQDGDVITLSAYSADLAAGMAVGLVLGCDHTMDDCRNLHRNILNFGGQPAIPLQNPIGITNSYY